MICSFIRPVPQLIGYKEMPKSWKRRETPVKDKNMERQLLVAPAPDRIRRNGMSVLFKNGLVVTSTGSYKSDVFVQGEKIASIGTGLAVKADETVDATGKYILPGAIDPHTHIEMPFMGTTSSDDWKTGSIAAACGGTTTIIDFSLQNKGEMLRDAVDRQKGKAEGKSVVDFGIHPGGTHARPEGDRRGEEGDQRLRYAQLQDIPLLRLPRRRLHHDQASRGDEKTRRACSGARREASTLTRRLNEQLAAVGNLAPIYHARAHAMIAEEEAVDRAARAWEFHRQPHLYRAPFPPARASGRSGVRGTAAYACTLRPAPRT